MTKVESFFEPAKEIGFFFLKKHLPAAFLDKFNGVKRRKPSLRYP